jgi:hypothetical protein
MSKSSQSLRVLIHAGTHKTGTTSIQAVLSDHRKRLRRQGIFYPDTKPHLGGGRHAHHRFAHAFVGTDDHALEAAHRFVDDINATAKPGETILLSSEAFYRDVHGTNRWRSVSKQDYWALRMRYLARVAEVLPATETSVLLYLRRPDILADSLYRENVTKSLVNNSFYEWLRRTHPLFHYDGQIQAFSDAFPSVQVCRYEDAVDEGLVESFFRQMGLTAPAPGPWTRRSPDARLILWMRDRRPGTWEQRREFAASEEAMSLFDDYGATTLWGSAGDRDAFLHQFDGVYGADYFPPPQEMPPPATLSAEDARRIDDAWARWQHRNGHR